MPGRDSKCWGPGSAEKGWHGITVQLDGLHSALVCLPWCTRTDAGNTALWQGMLPCSDSPLSKLAGLYACSAVPAARLV